MVRFLLPLLLVLSGCGSVTVKTAAPSQPGFRYDEYYDGWFFGVFSDERSDVEGACPQDRVLEIRNYFSFEDILIGLFTVGIYTPRTTAITCAEEG